MNDPLRILIVDDNELMVKTLRDILEVKGYQTEAAYSGPEALQKVTTASFDCILSDIKMPNLNGVELYQAVKSQYPDMPVVLMTAYSNDHLISEGLTAGVVAVLTKPLDIQLVLDFLALLSQQRSVVIVDDDPNFRQTLGDILQARGFVVSQATQAHNLLPQVGGENQVVLLDMKLNGSTGLDVLRQLRQRQPELPVILVTGYPKELSQAVQSALALNAYTCFYKPLQIDQLLQVLTAIHHQALGRKLGRPAGKKR